MNDPQPTVLIFSTAPLKNEGASYFPDPAYILISEAIENLNPSWEAIKIGLKTNENEENNSVRQFVNNVFFIEWLEVPKSTSGYVLNNANTHRNTGCNLASSLSITQRKLDASIRPSSFPISSETGSYAFSINAACAAASRAMGTRNGEQET